jgi:hypothetical protein
MREQWERGVAMMRANGIDVYVDMVENQRDGDDGHFHFEYVDAYGKPGGGRFPKGPLDFHPLRVIWSDAASTSPTGGRMLTREHETMTLSMVALVVLFDHLSG